MRRPRKTPDARLNVYESITTEIDGVTYTGQLTINDVGLGKVMFDLSYGGEFHHDTSVFPRHSQTIRIHAESVLKDLVQASLAKKKPL